MLVELVPAVVILCFVLFVGMGIVLWKRDTVWFMFPSLMAIVTLFLGVFCFIITPGPNENKISLVKDLKGNDLYALQSGLINAFTNNAVSYEVPTRYKKNIIFTKGTFQSFISIEAGFKFEFDRDVFLKYVQKNPLTPEKYKLLVEQIILQDLESTIPKFVEGDISKNSDSFKHEWSKKLSKNLKIYGITIKEISLIKIQN